MIQWRRKMNFSRGALITEGAHARNGQNLVGVSHAH